MEWSKEATCQLIDLFKEKPALWDPMCKHFKNRQKKYDAWTDIASAMHLERSEVEKKMRAVIGQFHRELKKIKNEAEANEQVYETKWFAFHRMLFLKNRNDLRKTQNSLEDEKPQYFIENESVPNEDQTPSIDEDRKEYPQSYEASDKSAERVIAEYQVPFVKRSKSNSKRSSGFEGDFCHVTSRLDDEPKLNNCFGKDEYSIFGEHVACKLRKLPTSYAQSTVQFHINILLYQAELGVFNHPPQQHQQFSQVSSPTIRPTASTHPNLFTYGFPSTPGSSELPFDSSCSPSPSGAFEEPLSVMTHKDSRSSPR